MTYLRPDLSISDWWDWLQSDGKVVRIQYTGQFKQWPWASTDRMYNPEAVEYAGRWKPVPLTPSGEF